MLWYAIPWAGWITQIITGEVRAIVVPIAIGALSLYAAWMIGSGVYDKIKDRRSDKRRRSP